MVMKQGSIAIRNKIIPGPLTQAQLNNLLRQTSNYRSNLRVEVALTGRSRCGICSEYIPKNTTRVHWMISNCHINCFLKQILAIPYLKDLLMEAIAELTIDKMEGKF